MILPFQKQLYIRKITVLLIAHVYNVRYATYFNNLPIIILQWSLWNTVAKNVYICGHFYKKKDDEL